MPSVHTVVFNLLYRNSLYSIFFLKNSLVITWSNSAFLISCYTSVSLLKDYESPPELDQSKKLLLQQCRKYSTASSVVHWHTSMCDHSHLTLYLLGVRTENL